MYCNQVKLETLLIATPKKTKLPSVQIFMDLEPDPVFGAAPTILQELVSFSAGRVGDRVITCRSGLGLVL